MTVNKSTEKIDFCTHSFEYSTHKFVAQNLKYEFPGKPSFYPDVITTQLVTLDDHIDFLNDSQFLELEQKINMFGIMSRRFVAFEGLPVSALVYTIKNKDSFDMGIMSMSLYEVPTRYVMERMIEHISQYQREPWKKGGPSEDMVFGYPLFAQELLKYVP